MSKNYKIKILRSLHEALADAESSGAIGTTTLRAFDAAALSVVGQNLRQIAPRRLRGVARVARKKK